MEFINPIMDMVIPRVWNCGKRRVNYVHRLEGNLDDLKASMEQLKTHRDHLKGRLDVAEAQLLKHNYAVEAWLKKVESIEPDVDIILQEGTQWLHRRSLNGCCPKNCWTMSSYKLGRKVVKMLTNLQDLRIEGGFESVAELLPPPLVQLVPEDSTIGLDSVFSKVWSFLEGDAVRTVGLIGMGGVGKTTLLKKLNNEFSKKSCGFDIVLWVVISKDVNMVRIQNDIGKRLRFSWPENKDMNDRAHDIFNLLRRKQFVLLLDDVWERVDLSSIGIPHPDSKNKSRIVFTTRSEVVCGWMEADKKIRVECLNWDDGWKLFQNKVGENSDSFRNPEIRTLAETVAKECGGLPLALIVIGRTMASKETPQEWKHAITTLQKHAAEFSGMEDEVFPLLKFSYDSLPNDSIRSCFLFCSLYSEDDEIYVEELMTKWIGMGYIAGFDDMEEATNIGHDIIGILKATSLLEHGETKSHTKYVKMHDVIRDLAQWIACECGREKVKVLVKTGEKLTEAFDAEKWVTAHTISLMKTKISQLDDLSSNCSNLSTLLLSENFYLTHIPDDFFLFMPGLRFLDLSSNKNLRGVPKLIGGLVFLEYLDLSSTLIKELPDEVKNLKRLRYLFLNNIRNSHKIPVGVIGHLSNLQMIGLSVNNFGTCEDDRLVGIQELGCLARLKSLQTEISHVRDLESLLSKERLVHYTRELVIENTRIANLSLSSSPLSPCTSLGNMKRLNKLGIHGCREMKELMLHNEERGVLESLEKLTLLNLPNLVVSWETKNHHGLCFKNLCHLSVDGCGSIENLTWLLFVPNLQTLKIERCHGIKEIISKDAGSCDRNTFANLKTLYLIALPCLTSICGNILPFPSLKEIEVDICPLLSTLPLDSNNSSLQKISGDAGWWRNLEWGHESFKSKFTQMFFPLNRRDSMFM